MHNDPTSLIDSIESIEFDAPPDRGDALTEWTAAALGRAEGMLLDAGFNEVTMIPLDISDIAQFNGPVGQLVGQALLVLGTTGLNRSEACALVHHTYDGYLRITDRNA